MTRFIRNLNGFLLGIALVVFIVMWTDSQAGEPKHSDPTQIQSQIADSSAIANGGNSDAQAYGGSGGDVSIKTPKLAASAIAPSTFSSNPCYTSGSAAVGLPKISFGGGKPIRDKNCEKLETARMLGALGAKDLAIKMACATDAAKEVLGDACNTDLEKQNQELRQQIEDLNRAREMAAEQCQQANQRRFQECQEK